MNQTAAICAENLGKFYPAPRQHWWRRSGQKAAIAAVEQLSFQVEPGEMVAFLGPNGAGKSTTIKMLCGILAPSTGRASIFGSPSGSKESNRNLGLVFGTRSQLYMHMQVRHSLDLVAEIYGITGAAKTRRLAELADMFELGPLLTQRARSLSLGERMRCEVVAALVHDPKVLLADEPTIGLDVVAKSRLRTLIRSWQAERKATLLLTSHDLADVEALCSRCLLIDRGRLSFDGDLQAAKGDLASVRRITVTTREGDFKLPLTDHMLTLRPSSDAQSHAYELNLQRLGMHAAVERLSRHYGDTLTDIRIEDVSLEEVLRLHYEKRADFHTSGATP